MSVTKLKVSLDFGSSIVEVGTLIENKNRIFFRYNSSFLEKKIEISPFKMKCSNQILEGPIDPFDGLFGVFNDSVPDGWGRLLLDRKLIEKGVNPKEMGVLDRLSLIGKNGQGALIYEPFDEENQVNHLEINLDQIESETTDLLKKGTSLFLDDLYYLGGNSVGARPKVLVNYSEQVAAFSQTATVDFEPWIIKFSSLNDYKDSAKIEFAYYEMALEAGIEMNRSKLFTSQKRRSFFGTKRFDREKQKRFHFHSACGILHDNFRISSIDYGHIMDASNRLEKSSIACEKVFRIAVFNVLACNMDDHSKNIGFLMDELGNWRLAPAFDLTFSPSRGNHQSISVAGKYKDVALGDLLKLAKHFEIDNALKIIEKVNESLQNWHVFAAELSINKKESDLIESVLRNKRNLFFNS